MTASTSRQGNGSQARRQMIELAQAHAAVPNAVDGPDDRSGRVAPLVAALTAGQFRIVVMGEIKKGKSSFINALLGQADLLPTATDIATSTVFQISHGPAERVTVVFQPDDDEEESPAPQSISREQIREFGTEDGNPGNIKCVDHIAIELANPLLAEGLVLVDTPGVGGLFRAHRDITFRYAPQADVVFFILDSVEAVISEDEVRFLDELRKQTAHIVFLQTKIDIAGTEQIQAWKKRNLEILSGVLKVEPSRIPYYLVGAKLKQRADRLRDAECLKESGYLAVLSLLRDGLIPARDEILARRWLPTLSAELLAAGKRVSDRLTIVRETSPPKLAKYETDLAEAEREYDRWQTEVWPERSRTFQDETGRIKRDARNRLQDQLTPERRDCQDELEELRKQCQSAEQVNERGGRLLEAWGARWNTEATAVLDAFQSNYLEQLERLVGRIAADLTSIKVPELNVEASEWKGGATDQTGAIREAAMNSNVFGGLAGEAAKYIGAGAGLATVFGLVSNPVGMAVGAAAGVGWLATRIWTGVRGFRAAHERQRDAAVAALERALTRTGNISLRGATRLFEGVAADLDAAARTAIDTSRVQAKQEFTSRRQEIVQARTRSTAEARAIEERLKSALAAYQNLIKQFQEVKRQLEGGATPA